MLVRRSLSEKSVLILKQKASVEARHQPKGLLSLLLMQQLMALWILCSLLCLIRPTVASSSSSEQARSHIVYLGHSDESLHPDAITESHFTLLGNVLGSDEAAGEALIYSYRHGFSGFAARLTAQQVAEFSRHPDVVSVFPNKRNKLHTTESWDFLGLTGNHKESLYASSTGTSLWEEAQYGRDVIIGSLDTGVWPESESFSDHSIGPIPKKWRGTCQHGDAFNSSHCNRKLIGARYFYKGYQHETGKGPSFIRQQGDFVSARDSEGHGTHTSSTAGGRLVQNASLFGFANGTAKGGAPSSRIAIYKVCWPAVNDSEGGCFDADILKAFEKGIHDGVDVFTLSLGASTTLGALSNYTHDATAIGAFHAVQKGIVVVCSAGNDGPNPGTVVNVAPWIITVGASSLDRSFSANVILGNKATYKGETLSELKLEKKMYPLVSSADVGALTTNSTASTLCLPGSLDSSKVKGKIVACLRGVNARVEKGLTVLKAGGAGMILCNSPANGNEIVADAHLLPALQVSASDGEAIFTYINSTRSPVAYISPGTTKLNVKPAPVMAAFSSRGPNSLTPDILKPDITAPGLNILAAYPEITSPTSLPFDHRSVKFNIVSGTSMSCPHVAGIAALVKAYHPDWSPAAIKSAIVTTGYLTDNEGEPILDADLTHASPFSFGGGHINPNAAAHPGLVYDATPQDFTNFLCGLKYNREELQNLTRHHVKCPKVAPDASDLNYPAIAISNLRGTKSITRSVTNVGDHKTTYEATVDAPPGVSVSVYPSQLEFKHKGETKSFRVEFKVRKVSNGSYVFGYLTWKNRRHSVRSPIAVIAAHV